jgi:hypothetical protein
MSTNPHSTHMSDRNVAADNTWFTDAPPPETTPQTIEALRSAFEDGDIVVVRWYDPRLATNAPRCTDDNSVRSVDRLSVGFISDLPEDDAVWVQPFSPAPYSDDDVIAYGRIRSIHPLTSGAETFSCYASGRSQAIPVSRH